MTATVPRHPAKFTDVVIDEMALQLVKAKKAKKRRGDDSPITVLDPFAGVGKIHRLQELGLAETVGVELEEEWARAHPRTIVGDALKLPFRDKSFEIVATSPCMDQAHRVLTKDLRWVPCGDLRVGDEIVAFEEEPSFVKGNGQPARRRWTFAEVVRSEPKRVPTMRVTLANDDVLYVTPEHPWLANQYRHASRAAQWVRTDELRPGMFVYRQFDEVWRTASSREAGWLAGMYDGEGSLSLGVHGAPKMVMSQVVGPVGEAIEEQMRLFGLKPNVIPRKNHPESHQPINNFYVTGGMSGIMRALGMLRPIRLLQKWSELDLTTRSIQPEKVEVVAVERAFTRDIQEIETSSGTYIGEGYLMHNCYGNRMADHHEATDASRRNTYRHALGRMPSDGSAAVMQWGPEYRVFHREAIEEMIRVADVGMVNMSDHIRKGEVQEVVRWWVETLEDFGCTGPRGPVVQVKVKTPRLRQGANHKLRVDHEVLILAKFPS